MGYGLRIDRTVSADDALVPIALEDWQCADTIPGMRLAISHVTARNPVIEEEIRITNLGVTTASTWPSAVEI